MDTQMTYPHTFENTGITILRVSQRGAKLITNGITVAWIQGGWLREDGTLTDCGVRSMIQSDKTYEEYLRESQEWAERVAREKREREEAWKKQKEEGSKLITYVLEQGVLMSASSTAYKYVAGKGLDMYRRICNRYNYIPKSQLKVERRNCKVYVTIPKWLAEKHSIFTTIA